MRHNASDAMRILAAIRSSAMFGPIRPGVLQRTPTMAYSPRTATWPVACTCVLARRTAHADQPGILITKDNMSATNEEAVSVMNDLIETCRDGEQGFKTAAERADRPDLKALFSTLATQRATFKHELEVQVQRIGGEPADMGHVAAAAHRGWMAVKSALSTDDDAAILDECERGEDFAKKAYTEALGKSLPSDLRPLVARQADDVRTAHDRVRDLRNQERGAA